MTPPAIRRRIDFPVVDEFPAQISLSHANGNLPIEIKDGRLRAGLVGGDGTDKFLRFAMAIEAPGHALGFVLENDVHFIDLAVATDATHTAIHMGRVIEVSVVGHVVDFDPRHGLAGGPTVAVDLELGVVLLDVAMTIHAGLGGGKVGVAADLDVAVAVAAVQAELTDVNIMLKMDRLHRLIADARILGRKIIPDRQSRQCAHNRQGQASLDNGLIGALGKNISHVVLPSPPVILRRYEKIKIAHCERPSCGYQTLFMRATGIVDFS